MSINYDKLIQIYTDLLAKRHWIEPIEAGMDDTLSEHREQMQHVVYMLANMDSSSDEDKLNRWLGFIQGVLWANGQCTINQLREHVILCSGDSVLEKCGIIEP